MTSTLCQALEDQIKDLYNAENQLVKALPRMARAAENPALKNAFERHFEETLAHVERLEKAAGLLETRPTGKRCQAMEGLIMEGREAIQSGGEGPAFDIALVAAAQRIEHYEIAGYGTACTIAQHLGKLEVAELLHKTLDEEGNADKKLTSISQSEILPDAMDLQPTAS